MHINTNDQFTEGKMCPVAYEDSNEPRSNMCSSHNMKKVITVKLQDQHNTQFQIRGVSRLWGYKTFFMLNSAEHEIFSANKYENARNSWHFHIN